MREELTGLSRTQPMTEHTPTPWAIAEVKTSVGRCFKIGSDEMLNAAGKLTYVCVYDDYGYGDNAQRANAAFIVTAVNSHAALTSRVEELEKALRETADYLKQQSDRLTVALSQQGWVPRRSYTEAQRNAFVSAENTLRRAALQTGGGK